MSAGAEFDPDVYLSALESSEDAIFSPALQEELQAAFSGIDREAHYQYQKSFDTVLCYLSSVAVNQTQAYYEVNGALFEDRRSHRTLVAPYTHYGEIDDDIRATLIRVVSAAVTDPREAERNMICNDFIVDVFGRRLTANNQVVGLTADNQHWEFSPWTVPQITRSRAEERALETSADAMVSVTRGRLYEADVCKRVSEHHKVRDVRALEKILMWCDDDSRVALQNDTATIKRPA